MYVSLPLPQYDLKVTNNMHGCQASYHSKDLFFFLVVKYINKLL